MSQFQIMALIMGLVFASIGYSVGGKRGHPGLGAVLGFFLGIIGLLILLVIPKKRTYANQSMYVPGAFTPTPNQGALCPGCRAPVGLGASVCQRCGTPMRPQVQPPTAASGYSAIKPEAWWYQEPGQPLPPVPLHSSPPPPPPPPPPPGM